MNDYGKCRCSYQCEDWHCPEARRQLENEMQREKLCRTLAAYTRLTTQQQLTEENA